MYEPTYPGLMLDFYDSMLESMLNPDVVISEVKGKSINVTLELIINLLGLPNLGIILKEVKND